MPKVSVLMPAYNSEAFVAEAIESILNQTYTDFEFIIINDGSTDKTAEIIDKYAKNDSRIKFINNHKNQGLIAVLNQGLDLCTGEYVARMDSDDISMPQRFEKQVQYMDEHQEVGILGTWIDFFPTTTMQGVGHHKKNIAVMDVLRGWCVNHPTVMMRKSVLTKHALRYRADFIAAEDYDLWAQAVRVTKIENLQETLLRYRFHEASVTNTAKNKALESVEKTKKELLNFLTEDEELQKRLLGALNPPKKKISVLRKIKNKIFN